MSGRNKLADAVRAFLHEAKTKLVEADDADYRQANGAPLGAYESGSMRYQHSFVGNRGFIGEEVVWKDGVAVWGMSYHGKKIPAELTTAAVMCLKSALRDVPTDAPYRGPSIFLQGGYEYSCSVEGDIDSFDGIERLKSVADGALVFELRFHGGFLA